MSKKDVRNLILFPAFSFLLLAAYALFFSGMAAKDNDRHEYNRLEADKKYEQIFLGVNSGKIPITTEKWIKMIRQERKTAQSDYGLAACSSNELKDVGEFGIIFAAMNVLVVLYVRDNIKKRERILTSDQQKK